MYTHKCIKKKTKINKNKKNICKLTRIRLRDTSPPKDSQINGCPGIGGEIENRDVTLQRIRKEDLYFCNYLLLQKKKRGL